MTRPYQLEPALEFYNKLIKLIAFRDFLRTWNGRVGVQIGSYETELSMSCTKEQFDAALAMEERMIRNTLEAYGIELEI